MPLTLPRTVVGLGPASPAAHVTLVPVWCAGRANNTVHCHSQRSPSTLKMSWDSTEPTMPAMTTIEDFVDDRVKRSPRTLLATMPPPGLESDI